MASLSTSLFPLAQRALYMSKPQPAKLMSVQPMLSTGTSLEIGVSQKVGGGGYLIRGPHNNEDSSILRSILESPFFGNYHIGPV